MKRIKLFEDFIKEAKEYKKGDKVTIQDGKFTKDAVVTKDGIQMHRGDAQVMVRIKGFPMDMGISLDTSKPAYIIE
jgi:transcription antitermination factor NusG